MDASIEIFFFWSNSKGDCKCSKNTGPSPLRSIVHCPSNQAQTIEFVERVKN